MYSQLFTRLTCRNILSIDIEERIVCIDISKNSQFLNIERQFVDIQPMRHLFNSRFANPNPVPLGFCKNKFLSLTNTNVSKIRHKLGRSLIKMINSRDSGIDPCGTPKLISESGPNAININTDVDFEDTILTVGTSSLKPLNPNFISKRW